MKKAFNILLIVLSVIIGLATMAISREKRKERIDNLLSTSQNVKQQLDYKAQKIGSSNLVIQLPYELKKSSVTLPQDALERLNKNEVYIFSKDKSFEGKIAYMVWNDGIDFSFETATDGAISNIKKLDGVEKVLENREYFKDKTTEGYIYDAVIYRYGKSFQMKGAIAKSGQETWSIVITFLNQEDESIANKILNSIKQ